MRTDFDRSRGRVRGIGGTVAAIAVLSVVVGSLATCARSPGDTPESLDPSPPRGRLELQELSPFERHVLTDKWVTAAELDEARIELIDCLQHHGIRTLEGGVADPGPSGVLSEFVAESAAEADRLEGIERDCRTQVSAVAEVWVLQQELDDNQKREAKEAFIDCIMRTGIRLPSPVTFDEALRIVADSLSEHEPSAATVGTSDVRPCVSAIQSALTTALPGLREALEQLNTQTWLLDQARVEE